MCHFGNAAARHHHPLVPPVSTPVTVVVWARMVDGCPPALPQAYGTALGLAMLLPPLRARWGLGWDYPCRKGEHPFPLSVFFSSLPDLHIAKEKLLLKDTVRAQR